ncbi:hypothetical protein [Klebsiella pneumoniae]|uniref:hypothetical protein n=1 Tax=Klebsiella pneumoniae TaxID=573 RepID=UPI00176D89F4|nr:hypothetical protein [Klebsiella pneumoniae]EES4593934.1 hypothetical protein [Escherichia coli]HCR0531181.1 hypothetical protein [Enterobacter hormaechei]HDO0381016.1 hypothetical protein [Salmonella enterica subsp. enterica serovar Typhimurium]EES5821298.1 hypothetical protein [Escherichia coli]HAI0018985.1 hypothetical protein [Escherichia coli]
MTSAKEKPTVRQLIEDAITAAKGDVRQASVNVCAILEDKFGFGEEGHFDDDQELIDILIDRQ